MNQRLQSIDILRGLTVMLMIIVNSPGTWEHVSPPLRHSAWNGLTLTDVVFPCFMFIMGITTYISMRKYGFALSRRSVAKIVRRALVLFALGLLLNWLGAGLPGPDTLRVPGVLQRFGVCYLAVSLASVALKPRRMAAAAALLLAAYAVLLVAGNGYAYDESSLLSVVDRACLGTNMMYDGGIDPEGILSTIPSIAHVMIGYCAGAVLLSGHPLPLRLLRLAKWGTAMLVFGFLTDSWLPVNKKIWSPSFVLVTCGLSALALVLLAVLLDVDKRRMPKTVFLVFGMNPLVCYVLAGLLSVALCTFSIHGVSLQGYLYGAFASLLGDGMLASFAAAVALAAAVGLCGWTMYRRRIFIKI